MLITIWEDFVNTEDDKIIDNVSYRCIGDENKNFI